MAMMASSALRAFRASFGPGLLWAAAAIGVSHLVQSTRAGALAGLAPASIILIALILKYPFFEYGPRYAAATGTSLVCASCATLLFAGRFRALDAAVKVLLVVLAASTVVAAAVATPGIDADTLTWWPRISASDGLSLGFVLALVGWMPSAIDISVWSSLWTLEKDRTMGVRTSPGVVLADFRVGYAATGLLAFAFLVLGAALMHASGGSFSPQGTRFSAQLVELYTATLGSWTRPVVVAAVLTTMLSTSLTVIDGFPRAIARSLGAVHGVAPDGEHRRSDGPYWTTLASLGVLTVVVLALSLFLGSLTAMVDFATIVSFLTAPVLGYLNLRAVRSDEVPARLRPGPGLLFVSYAGLALLGGVALVYLGSRLG